MVTYNIQKTASLAMGAAFMALGLLEIAAAWVHEGWIDLLASNGNLIMGLVLVLTGAMFFVAAKGFRNDLDGDAYLIMSCLLGLFVGLVALLTLVADASQTCLLSNEDFAAWVPSDDFTPAILTMVPCAVILWYQLRSFWSKSTEAVEAGGPL